MHLPNWESTENCYIMHLSIREYTVYKSFSAVVQLGKVQKIAMLCIWASAEYNFYSHFLQLSNWESAENCYIMQLSIWASAEYNFYIVIFCSCPIGKVQKIAILCSSSYNFYSHFLQLSNWGSAENSHIMHQGI